MSCSLDEIFSPIKKELDKVRDVISSGLVTENSSLSKMGRYLFSSKGKLIRPALVLLAGRAAGCRDMAGPIRLAGAVELIHTATLVHDDIIDNAVVRRNRKTINEKFGESNAILLGDYLYSASFKLLSRIGSAELFSYIVNVTREICEGETNQLALAFRRISEKKYLEIIKRKTAGLFEASCRLGAMCGNDGDGGIRSLGFYGYNFGMAYQILDDCVDIIGDEKNEGKSLGRDMQEGKYTLPVIYGAVDKAFKKGKWFVNKARRALDRINGSVFKDSLLEMTDFIIDRVEN